MHYFSVCGYRSLIKVKFIHQGEGHIKVKVKYLHPFKFYVAHTFCKPGGLHSTGFRCVIGFLNNLSQVENR